ncbi:unnamed protein product [Rotaria socialis]|uniref:Uncharacterized protein n=1 Tax=Rotaria socialis TaxID=392032 RepID=A0A817UBC2_9BILA|nr:unnamed protein product [Rotaria socialis]
MAPYYDRKSPCRNTAKYGDLPSYTTVGCRSKSGTLPGNTAFSENLVEVIPAPIRCFSCVGSGNGCVELRMKFCIE